MTLQPTNLRAVHRDGQTFLTYTEVDQTADTLTMSELYAAFSTLQSRGVLYRVYRASTPIVTLDGLSPEQFQPEVLLSLACIRDGGVSAAESLARSFGL